MSMSCPALSSDIENANERHSTKQEDGQQKDSMTELEKQLRERLTAKLKCERNESPHVGSNEVHSQFNADQCSQVSGENKTNESDKNEETSKVTSTLAGVPNPLKADLQREMVVSNDVDHMEVSEEANKTSCSEKKDEDADENKETREKSNEGKHPKKEKRKKEKKQGKHKKKRHKSDDGSSAKKTRDREKSHDNKDSKSGHRKEHKRSKKDDKHRDKSDKKKDSEGEKRHHSRKKSKHKKDNCESEGKSEKSCQKTSSKVIEVKPDDGGKERKDQQKRKADSDHGHVDEIKKPKLDVSLEASLKHVNAGNDDQKSSDGANREAVRKEPECHRRVICKIRDPGKLQEKEENLPDKSIEMKETKSKSGDSDAQKLVGHIDLSGKQNAVEDGVLEALKIRDTATEPTESASDDKRRNAAENVSEAVGFSSTSKSETQDVKTSSVSGGSRIEKDTSQRAKEESFQQKQTKTSKEVSESSRKGKEEEKEVKKKVDDGKKGHSSHTDQSNRDKTDNSARRERDRIHDKDKDRSESDRRGTSGKGESKYRSRESHKDDHRHRNDSKNRDQSKKEDPKETEDSHRKQDKKSTDRDRSHRSSDRRNDDRRQHSDRRDEQRSHSDRRTQNKDGHVRDRNQDEKSRERERKDSRERHKDDKNKMTAKKDDKTSGKQQTADADAKDRKEQRSSEEAIGGRNGTTEKDTPGKVMSDDADKGKEENVICNAEGKDGKPKRRDTQEKGKSVSCEKAKELMLDKNTEMEEKSAIKNEESENVVGPSIISEKLDGQKEEKNVSSNVKEKETAENSSTTETRHLQRDATSTEGKEKEQKVAATKQSRETTDEVVSEKALETSEKESKATESIGVDKTKRDKCEVREKKNEGESEKDKRTVSSRHRGNDEKEKRKDTRDKGRDNKEKSKGEKTNDEDRNRKRDEREKPKEGQSRRREDANDKRDGKDKSKDEEKRRSNHGRDREVGNKRHEKEKHEDRRKDNSQRHRDEDIRRNEKSKHESKSTGRENSEKSKESYGKEKVENSSSKEGNKISEEQEEKYGDKDVNKRHVKTNEKESSGDDKQTRKYEGVKDSRGRTSEEKAIVKEENNTKKAGSFCDDRSGVETDRAEDQSKPIGMSAEHVSSLSDKPCGQKDVSYELEGGNESKMYEGEDACKPVDNSSSNRPVVDDSLDVEDHLTKKEMKLESPEESITGRHGYTETVTQSIIDDLEAYVLESTNMSDAVSTTGPADDSGHPGGQDSETGKPGRGLKSRFNISITASSLQRITGLQGTSSNSFSIISKGTATTAPQTGIGTFSKPGGGGTGEARKEAPLRGRLVDPPWVDDNETEENAEVDVKVEVVKAASPVPEASDFKPDSKPEHDKDAAVVAVAAVTPVKIEEEQPKKRKRSKDRRSRSSSRGHRRTRNKRRRSRSKSRGRHRSRRKRRRRGRRSSRSSSSRSSTRSSSSSSYRRRRTSDRRRRSHSRSGRRTSKRRRRDRSRSSHRSRRNASPADKRRAAEVRLGIDRKKLRRIAILNMLRTTRPGLTNVASLTADELQRFQAGGVEMDELQEICKELTAKQEKLRAKGAAEHIIEAAMLTDEEEVEECRAKAKLESADRAGRDRSDKSKTRDRLAFNISEAVKVVPLVTPAEPVIKREQLLEMFPVSSGIRHQTSDETKPASDTVQSSSVNPEGTAETAAMATQKSSSGSNLGEFTGKVELVPLSQKELQAGIQPWLKKNQFVSAAPVTNSIGQELLKRMGWREGEGLGKNKDGLRQPVLVDIKVDRKGLSSVGETVSKKPQPLVPASQTQNQGTSASTGSAGTSAASAITSPGVAAGRADKHPVSILLEHSNRRRWNSPQYQVVSESGPSHSRNFLMSVTVNGQIFMPSAPSRSKKEAKLAAANAAVDGLALE